MHPKLEKLADDMIGECYSVITPPPMITTIIHTPESEIGIYTNVNYINYKEKLFKAYRQVAHEVCLEYLKKNKNFKDQNLNDLFKK